MLASVLQIVGLTFVLLALMMFGGLAFGVAGMVAGAVGGLGVTALYVGLALDREGG